MDDLKDARAKIMQLRVELNQHNYLYYVLNAPVMTDAKFDQLFRELIELERQHPELADVNSPTSRVGCVSPNSGKKVRHASKMLSLDNAFNAGEVVKFFEKGEQVAVEPKIDGFSLELIYDKGSLVRAVTRGDGSTGDDVTANARTIQTIPLRLTSPLNLRIRGEVYFTFTAFNRLNAELDAVGDELFANPRNAASGTIKLKDPAAVAKRQLSFVAYGTPDEIDGIVTQADLIEYLHIIGFNSITALPAVQSVELPSLVVTVESESQITTVIEEMDAYRKNLDLATDGLVLKVNRLAKQRDLGDGTRAPKWAIAYKYPPERRSTKLIDIILKVGKSGKLTPVAEFEPVSLSGTVVTYASLCNADEIGRLDCNVGDEVWVEKSAEIIPKVMGVSRKHSRAPWKIPKACPCCQTEVVRDAGKVDYYCPNKNCAEQVFARLSHALGKGALDVDGCGDVTVKILMANKVRTLSDFFAIEDLSFLKPAARKKLQISRTSAKAAPLWRKLHALGIDGLGRTKCQELAELWPALHSMFDDLPKLETVLGKVRYQSFIDYMKENKDELSRLDELGVVFEDEIKSTGPLTGKYFSITGSLASGKRDEVAERIEAAGGIFKNSVTKSVNYLVAGEDCGKNKMEAALKIGVTVITEEELYRLMGIPMPVITSDVDPDREF